jgi:hypothetical protein
MPSLTTKDHPKIGQSFEAPWTTVPMELLARDGLCQTRHLSNKDPGALAGAFCIREPRGHAAA